MGRKARVNFHVDIQKIHRGKLLNNVGKLKRGCLDEQARGYIECIEFDR